MPWSKFLKAHWEAIAAADFFTVEVWTRVGLIRYLVFFVIDLSTRRVEIAGIVPVPNGLCDLPPRVVPHPMLVPAPVEGREGRASSGTRATA